MTDVVRFVQGEKLQRCPFSNTRQSRRISARLGRATPVTATRLAKVDREHPEIDGWEHYRLAGIDVVKLD